MVAGFDTQRTLLNHRRLLDQQFSLESNRQVINEKSITFPGNLCYKPGHA
jgi:hypothetical protein